MIVKVLYAVVVACFLLAVPTGAVAQNTGWLKVKKADKLRSFGKIDKAMKKYESVIVEDPNNPSANFQLGKMYLLDLEDFPKAEKHLTTSIKNFKEKDTIYMAYYYLAETQKLMGNYPQAIENYNTFKARGIKDIVKSKNLVADIDAKIDECKLAQAYAKDNKYTFTRVVNLGDNINSNLSEYCSIFFPETGQIMYTARYRDSDKEKRFMDFKFYEGGYSFEDTSLSGSPQRLNFNNKDKAHFSVVSKTASGDSVIFYKDNKLWISTFEKGSLSEPKLMPEEINRGYYQPHGTFSPDGKQFIFSSSTDKKIQLDLYSVAINNDKSWSEPILLSNAINTKHNEDSPFFSKDGKTLYFASNKPGGFGKYDIYFSKLDNGTWSSPNNIGMPINSSGEDIFFSLNDDNKTGFLSSNRGGGFGAMDIYMFTEEPYPSFDCEEYLAENNGVGKNSIKVLDELVMNEPVRFDVSNAKLDGAKISNIFWKVDDNVLKVDSPMLTYVFTDTGDHQVTTQIYGKNKKTDKYEMDCSTEKFRIMAEGPLFLEVITERMVKVGENTVIDAETFYLGDNKTVTDYRWFIDEEEIDIKKQSYSYSFSDTGYREVKVVAEINDKAENTNYDLTSSKKIFVYDDTYNVQVADNGDPYIPGIELYENTSVQNGRINALKADVYGVPDDRRVFYSWYINNAEVKGRQTELLSYDFEPLSVVTVKAFVMHEEDEPEFTLEASKIIPDYKDGIIVSNIDNDKTNSDVVTTKPTKDPVTTTTVKDSDETIANVDGTEYSIKPVYFLFDKYFLTSKAKATINENIKSLKANPNLKVVVEGNTDSMGPSAYNLKLSEKRAKSVYKYLKSKGITDKQIQGINSNGESLPKAPNTLNGKDNPKGRQENRRVDFTIVSK